MGLMKIVAVLALAAVTAAWRNQLAFEFTGPGCGGKLAHAWVGSKYQQIKMGNTTQSVYISTVNDGIYRWYGFSESTEDGNSCYGDLVGRMYAPCFDLTSFAAQGKPVVKCIRYCSLWADKESVYSCASIGVTE
ncbi:hypothetical protein F5Y19DRAFT_480368 [Xylariaceae sp. FL1651]|nr:hypothetical protein F5Y19DRAFT_480368 [Xylariaceae sp. FL1651]